MPQLRVYRSFIKKAADSGKYLIIWDERRRYEGLFKGFDPQGEFVVLSDVTIYDGDERISSPEILIPIEDIKIVSTETEEERNRRFASKLKLSTGILMPGVTKEEIEEIKTPLPEEIKEAPEAKEIREEPEKAEKAIEEKEEISFEGFSRFPLETEEPVSAVEEPKSSVEVEAPKKEPVEKISEPVVQATEEEKKEPGEKESENVFSSVLEAEPDTSVLSPETRELLQKFTEKLQETPEVKSSVEETKPEIRIDAGEKTEISILEEEKSKIAGQTHIEETRVVEPVEAPSVSTQPAAAQTPKPAAKVQAAGSETTPKPAPEVSPKPKTTEIIEKKSEKAASSKFFAKSEKKKPVVPKRKLDLGTLILDILIVILGILAIGILAVTILGIKLPF